MKHVSQGLAALGGVFLLVGVVGRFYSLSTITFAGHSFAATSFLLMAILACVAAIYMRLLETSR